MRTIAIIFFLIGAWPSFSCMSQTIVPAITLEKNVAGSEYGGSLMYQTKGLLSFGAFYQTSLRPEREGLETRRSFAGAVLNIPIAKSENMNFYVQSRFGFVDKMFFVVTPGVETEIRLVGNVWVHAGAGLRLTYPSVTTKISWKI